MKILVLDLLLFNFNNNMKNKNTYLYVILLPQMDEELNLGYMIKFGYSKDFDDRLKRGYNAYHRYVKVLHLYEGDFTMEDETRIKQYFRDNGLILYGDEYLKYCPEVLNFFETYNTSEKFRDKINSIPYKSEQIRKYHKVNYIYIEYIISKVFPHLTELLDRQNKRDEIYKILREYKEKEQYIYIKTEYGITEDELQNYTSSRIAPNPTIKACKLAEKFLEIGDTTEKLKMLVDLEDMEGVTEKDVNAFLELIPPKFKEYYVIMGPKFIYAFSCKEADIKREWSKLKSNEGVKDQVDVEIYKIFEVGKRYTKADIKETLKGLYNKLGYQKTAKASDLEQYFKGKRNINSG